jgi:hypothetical protein
VVDADGGIVTAKPSTPGDFSQGVRDSLAIAAMAWLTTGRSSPDRAPGSARRWGPMRCSSGAGQGRAITTKGHRDVIYIMRGVRGVSGLASEKVLHFPESNKPDPPIVPKTWIAGGERVDCKGLVVVELNEDRRPPSSLVAKGRRPSRSASCGRSSSPSTSGG